MMGRNGVHAELQDPFFGPSLRLGTAEMLQYRAFRAMQLLAWKLVKFRAVGTFANIPPFVEEYVCEN